MRPLDAAARREIGPYRAVAELGRGGMGRVLLATSPDGRLVAVKQVHARLAADEGFRERFRREVAASRKVSGAFTAAVVDADTGAVTPWFASAFVPGPSLGAAVEAAGPLPAEAVRRLAAGLATALLEIHRAGLIHRDLKPANVLLAEDGPRVIDFGIARAADGGDATELTHTGLVVGSPGFMSPEQADGRELTPASDVFALGTVLAAALTGRSPFSGTSVPQTLFNVVHAEPDLSALPPGLRAIVEPCLAKDPEARPAPARLLELVGEVPPAHRAWPPPVHALIAAQHAEIDRLLGDPDRTIVEGPASRPAARRAPAFLPPATRLAPTLVLRRFERRRPVLIGGVAAAVLLVAAVVGGGAYALWPDAGAAAGEGPAAAVPGAETGTGAGPGDGSAAGTAATGTPGAAGAVAPSAAGPADRYLTMPVCSEAASALPLPARNPENDRYTDATSQAWTGCGWGSPDAPTAWVRWELKRSDGPNATALQKKQFAERAVGKTPADGLGAGDAAFWDFAPEPTAVGTWICELSVLDGNLTVKVSLGGNRTGADCRAEAPRIARAMIAAMPPR
ncbi:serine/threonine-protein kinase [Actinomadura sp. WMMB 499]|uniref:serine/threonine-protein kinase n=1 Tax=Actinomadura sp. WMMB 499 TaxID=1219491 RepID=UPI001244BDC7|nr:serine/threonine-protein kinase [Actinomadura sp. WMMB 499]QFG23252.1 serine/threonine protein kinase [Actinomadura sp. WMMB 499]